MELDLYEIYGDGVVVLVRDQVKGARRGREPQVLIPVCHPGTGGRRRGGKKSFNAQPCYEGYT